MSDRKPLMPKATAVWLVDNTALTFEQIAEFCGLHVLEVKGIADDDVAQGIKGMDPITSGQLTRDEIVRGEEDPNHRLRLAEPKVNMPQVATRKKGPRYTPVSRRHDRPNAVLWLLRNHPELKDSQIMRLVGTTKPTIAQIRDRTHWNSANLVPQDPVTLGLCSQIDLDNEVQKAAKRTAKEREAAGLPLEPGGSLLPTDETTDLNETPAPADESESEEEARMFAKLQQLSGSNTSDEDEEEEGEDEKSEETPEASSDEGSGTDEDSETEEDEEDSEPRDS
ncbi:cell cycle transcriptional regulator TrcR [Filomicrobium sp.]|uniref:DUF1013 domain-containing protein n=1 Tax=Filomicrobium sp. TaxID=2024831 RepID=UPI00258DB2F5|nr:cell cycle transcriptional regulator TrcR [Filomicrobium sp.]MCV0368775.1 DUF1013 domain-containing protein [Filomicrobium sp.]